MTGITEKNITNKLSKLNRIQSFVIYLSVIIILGATIIFNFDKIIGYASGQKAEKLEEKYVTRIEVNNLSSNIAEKIGEVYSVMSEKNSIQNIEIQKSNDFQNVVLNEIKKQGQLLLLILKHTGKQTEILEEYQLNNLITKQ